MSGSTKKRKGESVDPTPDFSSYSTNELKKFIKDARIEYCTRKNNEGICKDRKYVKDSDRFLVFGFYYDESSYPPLFGEVYPKENYIVVTKLLDDDDPAKCVELNLRLVLQGIFKPHYLGASIQRIYADDVTLHEANELLKQVEKSSKTHERAMKCAEIKWHSIAAEEENHLCERICAHLEGNALTAENKWRNRARPKDIILGLETLERYGVVFGL